MVAYQRAVGNHAMQRQMRSGLVPTGVIRGAGHHVGNQAIQRMVAGTVQRAAAVAQDDLRTSANGQDIGQRIQAASAGGSALDAGVQRQLESGLGSNLAGVRVHTDGEADRLSRSVDAVAFTTGSHIFFRSGMYNPGSSEGMNLLAHEATHTVQQASGPVDGTPAPGGVSISDPGDRFEQAASAAAQRVVSGGVAQGAEAASGGAGGASVQRAGAEEDEVQTMRTSTYAAIQREGAEEEELQTMRASTYAAIQRQAAPEEEEPMQTMRASAYAAAVQREAAPEEEELQTMRTATYASIQREAAPEEEELQTMRSSTYANSLQRDAAEQ
jgi:hypothetical protein